MEDSLDEVLRLQFHNAQRGIGSVVNNEAEKDMLDLLHSDVNGEMLDANIARFFYTDAALNGVVEEVANIKFVHGA